MPANAKRAKVGLFTPSKELARMILIENQVNQIPKTKKGRQLIRRLRAEEKILQQRWDRKFGKK